MPMQHDMKMQIEGLLEAFSADRSKPFELKASFPFGSPSEPLRPSPPPPYQQSATLAHDPYRSQRTQSYSFQPITPPISATPRDSSLTSPYTHPNLTAVGDHHETQYPTEYTQQAYASVEEQPWNPTPILNQFNHAFSFIPPTGLAPPPSSTPSSQDSTYAATAGLQSLQPSLSPPGSASYLPQYSMSMSQSVSASTTQEHVYPTQYAAATPQASGNAPTASYVSPGEWQRSVASVFNPDGLKRRMDPSEMAAQSLKRAR